MPFTDMNLQCVACNEPFTFTAAEQEFFASKELNSPPKRCKACRKDARGRRRNRKSGQQGEYRSPAFGNSAPDGMGRGRRGQQGNHSEYRSPSFRGQKAEFDDEYRSPAFRDREIIDAAEEYRSPAFREYEHIQPEEEYRSPAFREYDHIRPSDEYRSPAFGGGRRHGRQERPLFEITCVACGNKAMVPFLPEEKDDPMCQDCYKEHKELLRKEARQLQNEEPESEQ